MITITEQLAAALRTILASGHIVCIADERVVQASQALAAFDFATDRQQQVQWDVDTSEFTDAGLHLEAERIAEELAKVGHYSAMVILRELVRRARRLPEPDQQVTSDAASNDSHAAD